jgi:tRNA (guanine-N7-)-methyltransferase
MIRYEMMNKPPLAHRPIRSYVRREGRITVAQCRALSEYWGQYGIELGYGPLDLAAEFGRDARRVLEIGFGDGEPLARTAAATPESDYLGIEVHRPGIGHLLLRAHALGLSNLRVINGDAVEVVTVALADASFDRIQVYFPDPWPKARHQKRRLIQAEFVDVLANKLKDLGRLYLATDCEDYAMQMSRVLEASGRMTNAANGGGFALPSSMRPETKFEARGRRLGHGVWDLIYQRIA